MVIIGLLILYTFWKICAYLKYLNKPFLIRNSDIVYTKLVGEINEIKLCKHNNLLFKNYLEINGLKF